MKDIEDQELLLVTSVIYSDKFVLRGKRKRQVFSFLSNICCASNAKTNISKCCLSGLYFLGCHTSFKQFVCIFIFGVVINSDGSLDCFRPSNVSIASLAETSH